MSCAELVWKQLNALKECAALPSPGTAACFTLTFLWPGVILPEGMVFVNIGVQILQGILWNILSGHHFVIANNIRESYS